MNYKKYNIVVSNYLEYILLNEIVRQSLIGRWQNANFRKLWTRIEKIILIKNTNKKGIINGKSFEKNYNINNKEFLSIIGKDLLKYALIANIFDKLNINVPEEVAGYYI